MGLILKRRCGQTLNLQVRSVGSDGKIWINSDSFLPQTLIGNEVTMFTEVCIDGVLGHIVVSKTKARPATCSVSK